ncbi:MAG: histone deacetylase [Bdellovibrionaceae bacterium]|nr:histone deacetylase [Pseudobdellovibrionaceae bacterium]
MIKVFFDQRQSAKTNNSFSPSAQKPEMVVKFWRESGHPIVNIDFTPATSDEIARVHARVYVEGVLAGKVANGFGNTCNDVAQALPWVVGSMVSAALHAYEKKESCFSPTSGAHHAHYSGGWGFCTFNHLMLAAVMVHEAGAKSVGLIDLDCHYGDGSADIIEKLRLDYIKHYTFGVNPPRSGRSADEWLKRLPEILAKMSSCDLLILNAGGECN